MHCLSDLRWSNHWSNPCNHSTASKALLGSLHWLLNRQRVTFKLVRLIYRSHHETSPTSLSSLLHAYTPTRSLRSSSAHLLVESRLRTTLVFRGFWSAGPRIWNSTKCHQTCSLFLLVQIQTQNSPLYFNSSITDNAPSELSASVILDLRALQMYVWHSITLMHSLVFE